LSLHAFLGGTVGSSFAARGGVNFEQGGGYAVTFQNPGTPYSGGLLVASGVAVVPGTTAVATQGAYIVVNDAQVIVPFTPLANSSMQRIDIVYVGVEDSAYVGGASDTAVIGVVLGAEASTPVVPALPASAQELARINLTSDTTATITDRRTRLWLPGTVQLVTSTTRPTSPTAGQAIYETDTGREYKWSTIRSSWRQVIDEDTLATDRAYGKYIRTTALTIPNNTVATFGWEVEDNSYSFIQADTTRIKPTAGLYIIELQITYNPNTVGARAALLYKNGAQIDLDSRIANISTQTNPCRVVRLERCNGTDYFQGYYYQSSGGDLALYTTNKLTHFSFIRVAD